MSDDPFRDDLEVWQSGDGDRHPLVHHDTTTAPNATANATACIERDIDGNPFPGANQPPHFCETCARWERNSEAIIEAPCSFLSGLNLATVWTNADFGCTTQWRAKEVIGG